MNREQMIGRLGSEEFDVVIIGGGASGLGVAVDAASRGYRTALVEGHDFAKATSSRSTKLVHGGVRYLEQLNFSLVTEALRERGIMYHNAPHLVSNLAFVVPRYKWWEGPFYGIGMKLYDALAGKLNIERSKSLDREATIAAIPNVQQQDLIGGIMYHDGQFDDARMAVTLARTAVEHGAAAANYLKVTGLLKRNEQIVGVQAFDGESGHTLEVRGRVVVNATGIFSDAIRKLDDPTADELIEPAQGVHLILPHAFQQSDAAIMVPHTDDGRVLFVIPWHERAIVGTTDTPMDEAHLEPRALPDEVDFILRNAARYMERDPGRDDVLSVFAGQRPLVHPGGKSGNSKSISRSHEVFVSHSGLVSITGGKWTTYRKMAEDTLTHAIEVGGLEPAPCRTEELRLHGYLPRDSSDFPAEDHLRVYGSDAVHVQVLAAERPELAARLHEELPYTGAEIVWAVRHEMARKLEDALARRTRSLLLDARASAAAAESAAAIMAAELGRDEAWVEQEVTDYRALAKGYVLNS
jgi:glycerol-3-phosphate dehydrogenase